MQCWTDPLPPSIHPHRRLVASLPRRLPIHLILARSFHSQFGSGLREGGAAQAALFMRELIRSDVLHPI